MVKRRGGSRRPQKGKKRAKYSSLLIRPTGSELKWVDYTPVTVTASTTNNIYTLNFVATGSDAYNRVGRKINVKSIQIKARFVPSGNAAINDMVRLMVVYDRQGYQGAITFADIVKSTDSAGLTSSTVYDHKNPDNESRFKILMDQTWNLPQNAASIDSSVLTDYTKGTMIDKYIKCNTMTDFQAGSNIPDTGAIYFVVMGQQVVASAPTSVQWTSRVRFTDN